MDMMGLIKASFADRRKLVMKKIQSKEDTINVQRQFFRHSRTNDREMVEFRRQAWTRRQVLFHLHKKMKNMSKKSERSKRKTAQTVLLVVTAFTICWMPHHIIAMWVEFGTFPLNDATFAFRIVSHCLSYGNSCINPILYAFLSENFRKACQQVFTCSFLYPPPPKSKVVRFRIENFSTTHSTTNI